jgi:hypothetical protein
MTIEQLRYEDIGQMYVSVGDEGATNGKSFLLYFHEYVQISYSLTVQALAHLEGDRIVLTSNQYCLPALSYWFISTESFINSIWKVISEINQDIVFSEIKKKDISQRIRMLLDILEVDKEDFYRAGVFQAFQDFVTFRNDIFHDRQHGEQHTYNHSCFSKVPPFINQVDILQAMQIAIGVFNMFRYVLPAKDIMPEAVIHPSKSKAYEKIDTLYNEIIYPSFYSLIKKHNLDLASDLSLNSSAPVSTRFFDGVTINFHTYAFLRSNHSFSQKRSSFIKDYHAAFVKDIYIEPGTFELPNYTLQKRGVFKPPSPQQ